MNYTAPSIEWAPLIPILVVLVTAALGVLVEAFVRTAADRRLYQLPLTVLALVVSLGASLSVYWLLSWAWSESWSWLTA